MPETDLSALYDQHIRYLTEAYGGALERCGVEALIVHSGRASMQSRFDDQDWPYKPTAFFAHWMPQAQPDSYLLFRPGRSPAIYRKNQASYWESPAQAAPDFVWSHFDVFESGADGVREAMPSRSAFIGEDGDIGAALNIDEAQVNPAELCSALDAIRAIKDDYERLCIARANAIAAKGHRKLAEQFAAGPASELSLHLAYLEATEQTAWETPYGNIVAIGEHAAVLHHCVYGRQNDDTGSLLVDAGATYLGYASDITRTLVRDSGEATTHYAALVSGIDGIQQELCAALSPGVSYESLHDRAHLQLAELLAKLELIDCEADEMVESGATRLLFPHGLGHSLGLQVHDVGCKPHPPSARNPHLRTTADVAVGHVFTIEPGCYFIPALLDQLRVSSVATRVNWPLLDQLRPLGGVRIEDNIAVTEGGSVNLTRDNWTAEP